MGAEDKLIILLDIKMPEMDGFAFLEEFEKLDKKTVANHDLHAFLNIRSMIKKRQRTTFT
jgi:CheY-like chemotaxis protein